MIGPKEKNKYNMVFYCVVEHTTDNKYIEHARLAIDSMEFVFTVDSMDLLRGVFVYKTTQDREAWRS